MVRYLCACAEKDDGLERPEGRWQGVKGIHEKQEKYVRFIEG